MSLQHSPPADFDPHGHRAPISAPYIDIGTVAVVSTEEIGNHRGRLIADIARTGRRVIGFAPFREDIPGVLAAAGGEYQRIPMDRTGLSPSAIGREILYLARRLREEGVDLVFTAGTRPNLVGTLAARCAGIRLCYAMIAGLGYAFTHGTQMRRGIIRSGMSIVLSRTYRLCSAIFVQNEDDLHFVRGAGWTRPEQPVIRTYGSGVDLTYFSHAPPPCGVVKIILISRLLREKGVHEFAHAARILKPMYPHVRFQVLGRLDSNPGSLCEADLAAWQSEGAIEYLGSTFDVRPYLQDCSVFVLPSYYREGVPRTILEALATGRAIITTDTPGCRDTVVEGVNGYLVPPRDAAYLAEKLERLILEPSLVFSMGRHSRRLAEEVFDVRAVNATLLQHMNITGIARHCGVG